VEVSAAVAADGTIVFGSNDRYEYGVGPDGSIRWRYSIGTFTYSSPVTLAGERVVFGSGSRMGYMNVLSTRNGHLIERVAALGTIWTAAAVDANGDLYFASRGGGIYGYRPSGGRLFTLQVGEAFDSYPAIAADGTLLVGGDGGVLRAIG
jgi:outer membrane protein assembly factor BamB